jgi:hypothetical protein
MTPQTAKALAELGRAAARSQGIPDDVVITMTVCADRDWCDLCDESFAQVTEDEFDEPRRFQSDQLTA